MCWFAIFETIFLTQVVGIIFRVTAFFWEVWLPWLVVWLEYFHTNKFLLMYVVSHIQKKYCMMSTGWKRLFILQRCFWPHRHTTICIGNLQMLADISIHRSCRYMFIFISFSFDVLAFTKLKNNKYVTKMVPKCSLNTSSYFSKWLRPNSESHF